MYKRQMVLSNVQQNSDEVDEMLPQKKSIGKMVGNVLMYLFIALAIFQFLYAFLGSFGVF